MKKQGFTVVELLIVIAVIGILAMISVVTYTEMSKRADDTARISESREIEQKIRIKEAITGSPIPSVTESANKQTLLSTYYLESFNDVIIYKNGDCIGGDAECNKKKIYIRTRLHPLGANYSFIMWFYWSNANNDWLFKLIYGNGEQTHGTTGTNGPWIPE